MTYGAVKLNLMVIGIVSILLAGGVSLLALPHAVNAAPITCTGDATDQKNCQPLNGKTAAMSDTVHYSSVLQKTYDHGILYTGETAAPVQTQTKTSMVPLPPALVLFGGAMLGMMYLGRRRKVKPVQDD